MAVVFLFKVSDSPNSPVLFLRAKRSYVLSFKSGTKLTIGEDTFVVTQDGKFLSASKILDNMDEKSISVL